MYSFFSNNTKRKAFIKALKEVEVSGDYINYSAEENAAALLPDITAKIAELYAEDKDKAEQEPTLDITSLTGEEVSQASAAERRAKEPEQYSPDNSAQPAEPVSFDSLFSSHSFLSSDQDYDDVEFLSPKTDNNIYDDQPTEQATMEDGTSTISEQPKKPREPRKSFNQRVMDDLIRTKAEKAEQDKLLAEKEEFRQKASREEKLRIEAEEQLKQSEQKAKKEKEEHERDLELLRQQRMAAEEQAAANAAALAAATAKKPAKKKSATPRKHRRRYDADIVGGFNY